MEKNYFNWQEGGSYVSLFSQVNLAGKALEAAWLKNEVLSNNIANADTPGFKRSDVVFQDYLLQAERENRLNDATINQTEVKVIQDNSELAYRMDKNNVDVDVEMANRAKNELYYNSIISQVSHEFRQMSTVLNAK